MENTEIGNREEGIDLANALLESLKRINPYHYEKHSRIYLKALADFSVQITLRDDGVVMAAGRAVVNYITETMFDYELWLKDAAAFGAAGWGVRSSRGKIINDCVEDTTSSSFQAIEGLGDLMKESKLAELRRNATLLERIFDNNYRAERKQLRRMENPSRNRGSYRIATWVEPEEELPRSLLGFSILLNCFLSAR